jgi:ribosome-binding protein aMBF1 (putative translation factor)
MPTSKNGPDKESVAGAENGPEKAPKTPIGHWLKAARVKRNTTQSELARVLRTEQSMIAMVENGDLEPTPALRARLQEWIRSGQHAGPQPKRGPYRT